MEGAALTEVGRRAVELALLRRVDEAKRLFADLAATDPSTAEKGLAAFDALVGDEAAARRRLDNLPDDAEAQLMIALMEAQAGHFHSSLRQLEAVEDRWPALASTAILRGQALLGLGRQEEALASFEGARKLDPKAYEARFAAAAQRLAMGDAPAAALESFAAIELEPGLPGAYACLARVLIRLRRLDLAAGLLEAAQASGLKDPKLHEARAEVALVAGQRETAIGALDALVEMVEARPDTEVRLAELYAAAGAVAKADTHLQRALQLDGDHGRAWFLAAQLLEAAGKHDRARTAYMRAIDAGVREAAVNLAASFLSDPSSDPEDLDSAQSALDSAESALGSTSEIRSNRELLHQLRLR